CRTDALVCVADERRGAMEDRRLCAIAAAKRRTVMTTDGLWFAISPFYTRMARVLMVIGAAAAVAGMFLSPEKTWPALLINAVYWLPLSVMGVLFIATQRLAGGRWSASLRRIPEALMSALPAAAGMMLVVFIGSRWIYPWARGAHIEYLRPTAVFARTVIALAVWIIFAALFRRTSLEQDDNP